MDYRPEGSAPGGVGRRRQRVNDLLNDRREKLIGIVVYEGVLLLNLAGPSEVFAAANRELAERERGVSGKAAYRVVLVSPQGGQVTTSAGIQVQTIALSETQGMIFDTIAIAGGIDIQVIARDDELLTWLQQASRTARRIAAFGGAAFVLAKAGLLDDKSCVTHWRYANALQKAYPEIKVDREALFVRDGNCFTTAGSSAAMDLAMQMVEDDHGAPLAVDIARVLVLSRKRPGEQPQLSAELRAQGAALPRVSVAAEWIVNNIDRKPTVAKLAEQFAMSERNFSRVFTKDIGMSPQRFLERAKLEAARRWLAESDLPIEKVARRTGYSGGEHMAQVFRKLMNQTPGEYRAKTRNAAA